MSQEYKTLQECFEEAGNKFPFSVHMRDGGWNPYIVHGQAPAGTFFLSDREGCGVTWGNDNVAKLIKPEPPKKYLWQVEENMRPPRLELNFLTEEDARKLFYGLKITPFMEMK